MPSPLRALARLAEEPPFRLPSKALLRYLRPPLETRIRWDLSDRPAYLMGIGTGAIKAKEQGIPRITVIEFGVATGGGLIAMEREARRVEAETGVGIDVFGFDTGIGLLAIEPHYRNHPNWWRQGHYAVTPAQQAAIRASLRNPDGYILGDVRETVPHFIANIQRAPIGFVSFDMDLPDPTLDALRIFSDPQARWLMDTPCYFDDIVPFIAHEDAGELLAIRLFNAAHEGHKRIGVWGGAANRQVDRTAPYLNRMYVAHNLDAITAFAVKQASQPEREPVAPLHKVAFHPSYSPFAVALTMVAFCISMVILLVAHQFTRATTAFARQTVRVLELAARRSTTTMAALATFFSQFSSELCVPIG